MAKGKKSTEKPSKTNDTGANLGFADGTEARVADHDSRDGGGRAKQDARAEGRSDRGFEAKLWAAADALRNNMD
ncbi:MAG: hypothetical protein AAB329_02835, partial [Pseudomonadota bacterium]